MLDIDEMSSKEIQELLQKVGHGHLGCLHQGKPYVMPMHYYLKDSDIYIFTTQGMKSHDMDANPDVCLQVEDVRDSERWRSVVVMGQAKRLTEQPDIDQAMQFIKTKNSTLSPAINRTWIDAEGRPEVIEIYRIYPTEMSGRMTDGVSSR